MKQVFCVLTVLCLLTVCLAGCGEAKKPTEDPTTTEATAVTTAEGEKEDADVTEPVTDETEAPSSDEPVVTDAPATPDNKPTAASKTKITRAEKTTAAVTVDSVTLNKSKETLLVGESTALTATVSPKKAADAALTWTSSNPAVAAVDATGKVTAKAAGTATVTVKAGAKSATCKITVDKYALTLPSFPVSTRYWNEDLGGTFDEQITDIEYTFSGNSLRLTFHGWPTYSSGISSPSFARVGWELCDASGNTVKAGKTQTAASVYAIGDTFSDAVETITGLTPGRYTLKIVEAKKK